MCIATRMQYALCTYLPKNTNKHTASNIGDDDDGNELVATEDETSEEGFATFCVYVRSHLSKLGPIARVRIQMR